MYVHPALWLNRPENPPRRWYVEYKRGVKTGADSMSDGKDVGKRSTNKPRIRGRSPSVKISQLSKPVGGSRGLTTVDRGVKDDDR